MMHDEKMIVITPTLTPLLPTNEKVLRTKKSIETMTAIRASVENNRCLQNWYSPYLSFSQYIEFSLLKKPGLSSSDLFSFPLLRFQFMNFTKLYTIVQMTRIGHGVKIPIAPCLRSASIDVNKLANPKRILAIRANIYAFRGLYSC